MDPGFGIAPLIIRGSEALAERIGTTENEKLAIRSAGIGVAVAADPAGAALTGVVRAVKHGLKQGKQK